LPKIPSASGEDLMKTLSSSANMVEEIKENTHRNNIFFILYFRL
jgi:hypothetical protein